MYMLSTSYNKKLINLFFFVLDLIKNKMSLNKILKKWCDSNLKPGMCYGGSINPITLRVYESNNREGKLVYQDGTACSASHAFHDVYLLDDGTYTVYVDCGQCTMMGGEQKRLEFEPDKFKDLAGVLDFLMEFCGHDPNSTGEFFSTIIYKYNIKLDDNMKTNIGRYDIPILSKCHDNKSLINAINSELTK